MVRGEFEIPLVLKQEMGPHLQMRWKTRGSCQLVVGTSGFISSTDRVPGPVELHERSPASSQVLRGNSGLFWWRCRRIGPHLAWTG